MTQTPSKRKSIIAILMVLISFGLLMSLGFWQLHRATYKRHLQALYLQRTQQQPIHFQKINEFSDAAYYPVKISGYFDNQHQFLLDNQFNQHRVGYHVITPLLPDAGGPAVLVNRGWVAASSKRSILPTLPIVNAHVQLIGIIQPPRQDFILNQGAAFASATTWPRRTPVLNLKNIALQLPYPIEAHIVELKQPSIYCFAPLWQPIDTKAYIHTAYAFQWFCLAATLLISFSISQAKRHKKC